jgi:prephenate dehydrogenase
MTDSLPATAAVVGLGLMGGSLARDLCAGGARVLGYDRDPETVRAAAEWGVRALASLSETALAEVELLVLALPVTAAAELLEKLAPALPEGCVVTDLGSTKRSIVIAAERAGIGARFVGSHPLAGDHRSGWSAAREGLFARAPVYLCPTRETGPEALERVRSLWRTLGARPQEIGAEQHDRQLAWTSHLPQAAASALAVALAAEGWRPDQLGPGGRDATRLAASSPEIWSAISTDNADLIEAALSSLEDHISHFRQLLRTGDPDAIHHFFSLAHRWSREAPPAP